MSEPDKDSYLMVGNAVININSKECGIAVKQLTPFIETINIDPIDKMGALCLAMGFIIDAGVTGDDKQMLYELALRTLARIMSVAPGYHR